MTHLYLVSTPDDDSSPEPAMVAPRLMLLGAAAVALTFAVCLLAFALAVSE